MVKTAIVFDHRGRAHGDQEGPLEIRYTYNRKAYYVATGLRVRAEAWFSGKTADMECWPEIEARLGIIRTKLEREINRCLERGEAPEPKKLRERLSMAMEAIDSEEPFMDWAIQQVPMLNVRESTRVHYNTLLMRLRDYGRLLSWQDMTIENIMQWDAWLHQLPARLKESEVAKGRTAARVSDATVRNYHKLLKRLLRVAVNAGRIEASPYDKLYGVFPRGDTPTVECLQPDELRRIEEACPTEGSRMEHVRDLFLLQAYTGMAYADLMAFDIGNYRQERGVWRSIGHRVKTGQAYVSQLLPEAVDILSKYGMRVPYLSNAKYNHYLKFLGETLGIRQRLTSHVGRHTFATMMLRRGVRIEHVQKMVGHASIVQTQRYAKVLAQDVYDDFERISKKK